MPRINCNVTMGTSTTSVTHSELLALEARITEAVRDWSRRANVLIGDLSVVSTGSMLVGDTPDHTFGDRNRA